MNESAKDLSPLPGNGNGIVIDCNIKELFHGKFKAVRDTRIPIEKGKITAFIGPSGCGKSTVLRRLNRMNDLVRGFRFEGHVHFASGAADGRALFGPRSHRNAKD